MSFRSHIISSLCHRGKKVISNLSTGFSSNKVELGSVNTNDKLLRNQLLNICLAHYMQ